MSNAVKDIQTVSKEGKPISRLAHGVEFHESPTHIDERGSLCEIIDSRWSWCKDPINFSYMFTIRPQYVKGWNLHKKHEDRYFVIQGDLEVTFYDVREDSPTYGEVSQVVLSPDNRRIMNIPTHVWHGVKNIGDKDALVINFPTMCYDHEDPDKYRLDLDTDEIPYKYENPKGW